MATDIPAPCPPWPLLCGFAYTLTEPAAIEGVDPAQNENKTTNTAMNVFIFYTSTCGASHPAIQNVIYQL